MDESIPAKVKRSLYRGDDRVWWHVFEQNTGTAQAPVWEPYDITDWMFLSQFRPDRDRGTLVCESEVAVFDGPGGIAREFLSHDRADLLPGQTDPTVQPQVFWDLQSEDGDGMRQTWKYAWCKVGGDGSDA